MVLTAPECKEITAQYHHSLSTNDSSYNGTSDLQLERMNVYFNEVCVVEEVSRIPDFNSPRHLATNMSLVPFLSISNPVPWMQSAPVHLVNFSVPTTLSSARAVLV